MKFYKNDRIVKSIATKKAQKLLEIIKIKIN